MLYCFCDKDMNDINYVYELEKLNPDVEIRRYAVDDSSKTIFSSVPASKLMLPYGSICKDKNHVFFRVSEENDFQIFLILPFREAVVKSFLPMERWIHDTSFEGIQEIFSVYQLKKQEDDFIAYEREYKILCRNEKILLKLKFAISFANAVSSALQCDKFSKEVFGEVSKCTYDTLQNLFFEQFSLGILEPTLLLQDIQVTGYILSVEIVEALFSKDNYFEATLEWFSYLYSLEKKKITEL